MEFDDYIYDEVRIDEITPGDEILSLNEETGEWEYQKVEALMDMGVKPIYKLTVASGKNIRTTGNHPYYVRKEKTRIEKWLKNWKGENEEGQDEFHLALNLSGSLMDKQPSAEGYAKINAAVYVDDFFDSGQSASQHRQIQKPQQEQLTFQSFFASIFGRLQEVSCKKTHEKSNTKGYSYPQGHLNKKITGQSYGKNSFGKIGEELREKFLFGFIKEFHRRKA